MNIINNDVIQVKKIEVEHNHHITNVYIILSKKSGKVILIDPAFDLKKIKKEIGDRKIDSVIVTHSHADHIDALADMVNNTSIKVYIHALDKEGLFDKTLNEEETVETKVKPIKEENIVVIEDGFLLNLDDLNFKFIHTPGHTNGSIVIYNKEFDLLFSGDTIFEKTYGRTDLKAGSHEDMKKTLERLFKTFKNPLVLPGHGKEFYLENSKRRIKLLFAYKG